LIPDSVIAKIKEISCKEDYEDLLSNFKTSIAPKEIIDEAIRELKLQHHEYDDNLDERRSELHKIIKDGEADISDIVSNW